MITTKPLEWKPQARPGAHEASTPLGTYTLFELPLGCGVSFHSKTIPFININDKPGVSLELAMQMAQADFERRTCDWYKSIGIPS